MNELMRVFEPAQGTQSFDQIMISIASPDRIRSWSFGHLGKSKSQRLLTIGRLNQSVMVFFVREYSAQSRIMSVFAVNTNG